MKTRFTEMLGIKHPVIQCGMGNVTNVDMVVEVCNAGGLGVLALGNITVGEYREQIREIKSRIGNKPFGANFTPLVPHIDRYVKVWMEEKVPVWCSGLRDPFSTLGIKKPTDVYYIPTIGKTRHGVSLERKGLADAVITHGQEGGGHPGRLSSTVLVTKTAETLEIPVIASGGFVGGRGLATALAMGAEGVGMGTRFALSKESSIAFPAQEVYYRSQEDAPVFSNRFDGVYCNVIEGAEIKPYRSWKFHPWSIFPSLIANTKKTKPSFGELWRVARQMWKMKSDPIQWCVGMPVFEKAMTGVDPERGLYWAGQVVGLIDHQETCREIVESTVAEAEKIIADLYREYVPQAAETPGENIASNVA